MLFKEFTDVLEKTEKTNKRNKKIKYASDLLRKSNLDEVKALVNFLMG